MQRCSFSKRSNGGDTNTVFGVDKSKLDTLPPRLRSALLAALAEAEDALASGDQKRQKDATTNIVRLVGDLQDYHAELITEKFFVESLKPLRGDHAVIEKFARRAGVTK